MQYGMQWILQQFEDTQKLADALDRLNISYSWHKVVPFIGELVPEPEVHDPLARMGCSSQTASVPRASDRGRGSWSDLGPRWRSSGRWSGQADW